MKPATITTADSLAAKAPARRRLSLRWWHAAPAPAQHAVQVKRNVLALLRQWHSRAGLVAFAFLIWLAASGILLTRSVELGLDTLRLDWPWLTQLYGLHAEPPQNGFSADGHWLAQTNDYTVLDGRPLAAQIPAPLGVVAQGTATAAVLFVASEESLILIDAKGQQLDDIRAPVLPVSHLRRIGFLKRDPEVLAVQDLDAFQSADGGNSWSSVSPTDVQWSVPSALPDFERQRLVAYAKPRVIAEQVLIDLHSGRLFGPVGAWAITVIGFVALLLSVSGIWMWVRLQKNRRRNAAR